MFPNSNIQIQNFYLKNLGYRLLIIYLLVYGDPKPFMGSIDTILQDQIKITSLSSLKISSRKNLVLFQCNKRV